MRGKWMVLTLAACVGAFFAGRASVPAATVDLFDNSSLVGPMHIHNAVVRLRGDGIVLKGITIIRDGTGNGIEAPIKAENIIIENDIR